MTVEVLMCGLGALLVLTGIVGGGLEVRELKIPKVGMASRVAAYVSGFLFILMGVVLSFKGEEPVEEDPQEEVADARAEPETPAEEPGAASEEPEAGEAEAQEEL
ncbi:hypothetical protein JRI60_51740 [Archangium violaceum]|uniref:hypothetical protein n=1 Tax=Archangium violaceum TaxID=83451 RepID=UPI00194F64FF|nr:hypothetical protein [Archangium violaceum]QRN97328.1 hypothetical protein JRI60_51740 [Archangium violaceum]